MELLRNSSHRGWQCLHTLWGNCHNVFTDHNVSHIVVCISSFFFPDGALCGSCCYFEETPARLTTGCQRLQSVILLPLFGLCDCSPAGGERSRLHSLLWICLDVWRSRYLVSYSTAQQKLSLYFFENLTMPVLKLLENNYGTICQGNPYITAWNWEDSEEACRLNRICFNCKASKAETTMNCL